MSHLLKTLVKIALRSVGNSAVFYFSRRGGGEGRGAAGGTGMMFVLMGAGFDSSCF